MSGNIRTALCCRPNLPRRIRHDGIWKLPLGSPPRPSGARPRRNPAAPAMPRGRAGSRGSVRSESAPPCRVRSPPHGHAPPGRAGEPQLWHSRDRRPRRSPLLIEGEGIGTNVTALVTGGPQTREPGRRSGGRPEDPPARGSRGGPSGGTWSIQGTGAPSGRPRCPAALSGTRRNETPWMNSPWGQYPVFKMFTTRRAGFLRSTAMKSA